MKIAKVSPLSISESKHEAQNYRPISLLSSISKVLEKFIRDRLVKFLHKHKIIFEHQSSFRENHSTTHALIDILKACYDNIENKQYTILLMMDLKKAFDTVNHEKLLHKLCKKLVKLYEKHLIMKSYYTNYITSVLGALLMNSSHLPLRKKAICICKQSSI